MTEFLLNWVADTFARSDIIDLYFILSELVDIPVSEEELYETAFLDSLAMNTVDNAKEYKIGNPPIGKMVL